MFSVPVLNGMDLRHATNKRNFFQAMVAADLQAIIPRFWTSAADIPDDAFPIVCRTELAGHSGAGIVIAEHRDNLVHAPLFVEYVKKQDEYRIHVGMKRWTPHLDYAGEPMAQGQFRDDPRIVISMQKKKRRLECETPNWQVRNHANGFIYARSEVNPPEAVIAAAKSALGASGLDFGAVDVIWNEGSKKAYVLEINTAPGLEGTTVQDYARFFKGETGVQSPVVAQAAQ
jgi:hypothetical protein